MLAYLKKKNPKSYLKLSLNFLLLAFSLQVHLYYLFSSGVCSHWLIILGPGILPPQAHDKTHSNVLFGFVFHSCGQLKESLWIRTVIFLHYVLQDTLKDNSSVLRNAFIWGHHETKHHGNAESSLFSDFSLG